MPLMHMKSVLVLMLMQTSAQALGYSKDVKRGAGFLIWDFVITFCWPFSAQGQVDLGCWTGWDEADTMLLPHAQSQLSRRLWVILCNAGCSGLCVQDALWICFQPSLWPFRQALYSVSLLFWTLIFPGSLSRESWGRKKHPGSWQWWGVFLVCLPTCPAAAPGVVEASWSVEELVELWTAGSRSICNFLLCFLFSTVISQVVTQDCITWHAALAIGEVYC